MISRFRRLCFGLVFLCLLLARDPLAAQEVPLERCDRLPAIRVEVAGHAPMLFLVDTAATSLLNLQSFLVGDSREVAISPYPGPANTRALEVTPPKLNSAIYRL